MVSERLDQVHHRANENRQLEENQNDVAHRQVLPVVRVVLGSHSRKPAVVEFYRNVAHVLLWGSAH